MNKSSFRTSQPTLLSYIWNN